MGWGDPLARHRLLRESPLRTIELKNGRKDLYCHPIHIAFDHILAVHQHYPVEQGDIEFTIEIAKNEEHRSTLVFAGGWTVTVCGKPAEVLAAIEAEEERRREEARKQMDAEFRTFAGHAPSYPVS